MFRASCVLLLTLCSAFYVSADEVDGIYRDLTTCDSHGDRSATEELGNPSVFSFGQQIDHVSTFTDVTACLPQDNPNQANAIVVMTNLTERSWTDLFYVGDPGTVFSNVDGFADAGVNPQLTGLAFRIDSEGENRPLVFESMAADNVFQPGEEWRFVVQDYSSPWGPADAFFSVGFADASLNSVGQSAASIVHFVPEPSMTISALAAFAAWVLRRQR